MRIKKILPILAFSLLLHTSLSAADRLYVLPKQTINAKEKIEELIKNAQSSIDIAMYNFDLKSFAKDIVEAKKRGVKVTVILDGSKIKGKKNAYHLFKKAGIEPIIVDEVKMHSKVALFDKKEVVFGSANWKKESFGENYELIYATNDRAIVKKIDDFFEDIIEDTK